MRGPIMFEDVGKTVSVEQLFAEYVSLLNEHNMRRLAEKEYALLKARVDGVKVKHKAENKKRELIRVASEQSRELTRRVPVQPTIRRGEFNDK